MCVTFIRYGYLYFYSQTQAVGVVVYSPIVTDADTGSNADFSFQLTSPVCWKFLFSQAIAKLVIEK